jgi:hypothetical protein
MSVNYELFMNKHPGWAEFIPLLEIFAAIAFFLLIPCALMKLFEQDQEDSETQEIDSTEIDDWFAFRKTYQTPK